MAELYIAHQRGAAGFTKIVALKRILPHLAEDPTFTKMFLDEARLASGLDHANLAHVLDFGEYDGEHFLTMEYVHGRNLLQLLRAMADRALPLASSLAIVTQVARGLHDLHEQRSPDGRALGLVHRDVSPSNVLLSFDGQVKLTDFGIAKAMELTSATRTGTFKGKLGHSSPEQARGEPVDRRSDVFSLGILLYEVSTGARAFTGANEFAVLGKVARADYEPPSDLVDTYPPELSAIVSQALSADPEKRPRDAAVFAEAIAAFARASDIPIGPARVGDLMRNLFGTPPPIADPEELDRASTDIIRAASSVTEFSPVPPPRGRPWLAYGLVPIALVLGAGGAWLLREPPARSASALFSSAVPLPSIAEPVPVALAESERSPPEKPAEAEAQAETVPQATEPAKRKPRRGRKKTRKPAVRKASSAKKAIELDGALFPPEP